MGIMATWHVASLHVDSPRLGCATSARPVQGGRVLLNTYAFMSRIAASDEAGRPGDCCDEP
jgi:hypothetical protein